MIFNRVIPSLPNKSVTRVVGMEVIRSQSVRGVALVLVYQDDIKTLVYALLHNTGNDGDVGIRPLSGVVVARGAG